MTVLGGDVHPARSSIVSPAELLMSFIDEQADRSIVPAGAVVGGADANQQEAGVVALMDAGDAKLELYAPLLWKRVQVRCMGPSLDRIDTMGNHVFDLLNDQKWLELSDSAGKVWFVHGIYCSVGPSHHIDSQATFESLLFATVCVGRDPVSVP